VGRARRELLGLLLVLTLPHLLFLALDQRPPNDHDAWYTNGVADSLGNLALADGVVAKAQVVAEHFLFEGWHPQAAQTVLLVVLGLFGPSLALYRGTSLLFLWLLAASGYAVGRQLKGHRFGLVCAGLLGWMPVMLAYARKWEPMFHGAAVSVLCLALALRCLREHRARWPWVAFGAALGLRFYTHPTGLLDIAMTSTATSAMALWIAHREGRSWTPVGGRIALAGGVALALGAWYLGLIPVVPEEPSYELRAYLRWRASYLSTDYSAFDVRRNLASLQKLARALCLWHWQGLVVVVLIPGLIATLRRMRQVPADGVALLTWIALLQVPWVHTTMKNGGMVIDWLHMEPIFLLVSLAGVWTLADRWRRPLLGLAAANVVFAAVVVPVLSLTSPDPLQDQRAWTLTWLDPYTHLDTGDAQETPHLISRTVQPVDRVAAAMARVEAPRPDRTALVATLDLTLAQEGPRGAPWCSSPGADPSACCGFDTLPRGGPEERFHSKWPFVFAGWGGLDTNELGADHRFTIVRYWHPEDVLGAEGEGTVGEPPDATPAKRCLDAAEEWVRAGWPGAQVTRLADPTARFVSRGYMVRTEYAHQGFLVDQGHGVATLPTLHRSPRRR